MDIEEPFSGEPLTCACPHCGKPLLTMAGLWVQCDEEDARYASVEGLERVCDCEAAREAEEQKRRAQEAAARLARKEQEKLRAQVAWMESELPRAWQDRGLSRWVRETETQQVAYEAAVAFGGAFCRQEMRGKPKGLYIAGDIGTGKTFLASCLAADLTRRGKSVLWCNVSDVLRAIRATFNNSRANEADVVKRYITPAVLFLDDLGKEKPTEWSMEQLFCIVNARYDKRKPIIVTTNYGGEELVSRLTPRPGADGVADDTTARAIVDRLRAMSILVKLEGKSWR